MAIYFYTPPYYVFNNFSAHAVEYEGVVYATSEHAYQVAKCTNPEGREAIRLARSPLLAKEIVHGTYESAIHPEWNSMKVDVMEAILRAKLAQHPEIREALIRSGTEELIEDSPVDYFWGAGQDGSGQNMLGKLWMKLRREVVAK